MGYPDYKISRTGVLKSKRKYKKWKRIYGCLVNSYIRVTLVRTIISKKTGKIIKRKRILPLHKIVLTVFIGERPYGMVARHLNDIKIDNRLSNLRWGTPKENAQDRVINEGQIAKITEEDAIKIKRAYSSYKRNGGRLARKYGLSRVQINRIAKGQSWAWVIDD